MMKRATLFTLFTLVSFVACSYAQAMPIMIDDFNAPSGGHTAIDTMPGGANGSSTGADSEVIGDSRDIFADLDTETNSSSQVSGSANVIEGFYEHDHAFGRGDTFLVYDGSNTANSPLDTIVPNSFGTDTSAGNGTGIDTTGLGGVDLTSGGSNQFLLFSSVDNTSTAGFRIIVTLFDNAMTVTKTTATLIIPALIGSTDQFLAFSEFDDQSILTNVGAIQVEIDGNEDGAQGSLLFDSISAVPAPEPASLLTLSALALCGVGAGYRSRRKRLLPS